METESRPILVVDDSATMRCHLSMLLEGAGYSVHCVPDGESALAWVDQHTPGLCLMDIVMPGLDGYQVCQRMLAKPGMRELPIIFISGSDDEQGIAQAFAVGAVDYVVKPVRKPEVLARVRTHMRLSQLVRELELANRELSSSYERLKGVEQLREDLLHMMVHDMRSPLMVILNTLDILREDYREVFSDDDASDVDDGLRATARLTEMVDSLLDINRLEERQLPIELCIQPISTLVEQAVVSLGGGDIRSRLHSEVGSAEVRCDASLVQRVLANLIGNAARYSPPSEPILVQVETLGPYVKVSVSDRGPGILAEDRERIFLKYSQGQVQANCPGRRGSGLGLAFCRLAINAMGGEIGVDSERGEKTSFWFTLPRGEPG